MRIVFMCIAVALFAAGIWGCGSTRPTPEQLASADYGPEPRNYIEITRTWLKDKHGPVGQSAPGDLLIGRPVKGWQSDLLGRVMFGYTLELSFTVPKSSAGGTDGGDGFFVFRDEHMYQLLINNGKVISYQEVHR